MAERGGQPGNQNSAKDRIWRSAIVRALEKRSRVDQVETLDALADKLIGACMTADLPALKELGDRLDGKPKQQIEASGPDGEALKTSITVEFVGALPRET